jgi:hypothetical protein
MEAQYVTNVTQDSPEWHKMWNQLFATYSNYKCQRSREVWEYMGTWNKDSKTFHQFRHRSYHGERKIVNITPSEEFSSNFSLAGV